MTLSVEQGERCVVLGPSGSGKSTLLRIAAGFDRPSAGVARTLGVDVMRLGARRAAAFRSQRLGFLDQHYARALSPVLSCADNVALPLALGGATPARTPAPGARAARRHGPRRSGRRPPAALSGGEQQRVAACAALAHGPALLLADEPAGELDASTARMVYRLLRDARRLARHDARGRQPRRDRRRARRPRRARARRSHQRRGAAGRRPKLVIGRGGWVRLPESARTQAGIGDRASWRADEDEVRSRRRRGPRRSSSRRAGARGPARSSASCAASRRATAAEGVRTGCWRVRAASTRGRLVAVEGRSGSGKTTLLHLIAGLERPDAGTVIVAGAISASSTGRSSPRIAASTSAGWARSRASSRSRRRSRTRCSRSRSSAADAPRSTSPRPRVARAARPGRLHRSRRGSPLGG